MFMRSLFFVSFDETQIVCINDMTEWLNFNLETDFDQHSTLFRATRQMYTL